MKNEPLVKCALQIITSINIKKHFEKNNIEYLDEIESYLLDIANSSNSGFVSEDGVVERWVGGINKSDFKKDLIKSVKIKKSKILNNEDN